MFKKPPAKGYVAPAPATAAPLSDGATVIFDDQPDEILPIFFSEEIKENFIEALTATNESVINTIKNMVTNNIQETKLSFNEQEITINNTVAKKLLTVYESINRTNKKKMEQMLNEDATSFNKVLMFAVRQ